MKKLFYIGDGTEGVAGSGFILEYLKKTYGDKLDENLRNQIKKRRSDRRIRLAWRKAFFMRATATSPDAIAYYFLPISRASIEITAERSRNVSSKLAGLLRPDEGTILEKLKEALRRAKTILHLHFSP